MSDSESRFSASVVELRREFKRVDRDVDGKVSFAEFKELMDGLDAGMKEADLRIGFHEVDTDKDGLIDQQEFIDWWTSD